MPPVGPRDEAMLAALDLLADSLTAIDLRLAVLVGAVASADDPRTLALALDIRCDARRAIAAFNQARDLDGTFNSRPS